MLNYLQNLLFKLPAEGQILVVAVIVSMIVALILVFIGLVIYYIFMVIKTFFVSLFSSTKIRESLPPKSPPVTNQKQ